MPNVHLRLLMLLTAVILVSCDRLSDGDDVLSAVLPGEWAFSYELLSDSDTGLEFSFQEVLFAGDGTCRITYPDGAMEGTFRAGDGIIRIDGQAEGSQRTMLWAVESFSERTVRARYVFDWGGSTVTAIVTLERIE